MNDLNEILEKHKMWLKREKVGKRADLRGANLENTNLKDVDLSNSNLENI